MNMLLTAAASIAVTTTVSAADISIEDLKIQNANLEARIVQLERGDGNSIAEKRSELTREMVQQILVKM